MTLTVEHFGVPGLNEEGSIGIVPSKCKKNCNFRGVCEAGTCYCQPGFSGKRCEKETLSKKGNYAMDEVGMVAVAVFLFFFLLTFTVLQYQEYSKKATERAMGYADFHLAAAAPIMGWMSWERFRCETDCTKYPNDCIHEKLYYETADALVASGLAAAGYDQVSIDDCWTLFGNGRDPQNNNRLRPDPKRFPGGIKKLADYVHGKGLKLGIYSDAGNATCGGYMGSRGFEDLDAQTFYEWGVDYLKLDGCFIDTPEEMEGLYGKMGRALKKAYGNHVEGAEEVLVGEKKQEDDFGTGGEKTEDAELSMKRAVTTRAPIKYSCSWPAYLGDDERVKPYDKMFTNALCDTWRNWADIDNSFTSLKQIVNHWAVYTKTFESVPAQAINDPDMILAGDDHYGRVLSLDAAKLQLAVWSVVKAPLFLAADVRKFADEFFKPYVGVLTDETFLSVVKAGSDVIGGCVYGCGSLKGESTTSQRLRLSLPFPSRKDNRVWKAPADVQIWSRRMGEKEIAVAFVNLNEKKAAKHHQQDEMVYDAGSVFIMLLSPLCLIWFPIVVAALALAGQKTLGHMVKKQQSGNFFCLELEILDAWKNRRQFRLTMAGIAYDGKGGDEVCLRTGYIRFPGGLQSYTRKSLCDLVTMETLMWYDEERQLVLVGYLYEFCAIVDINTEPAHFLEHPIFRLTDTVTVHPPGAMFPLDQRYWGLGISLKHPPGYRMTQMSYQSLEDPVIYMPGGLSNTIGGYADPDGKVHTPVPQNAKATEAGAPFPGDEAAASRAEMRPRKRLADATKLLAKWLEEHKASNGSKPAPADPVGSGAGEKICEEDSSIAMEQEQTRLVLDFVGLLDIQQASAGQSGDKNKKTTRKSKLPAKNRTKTATAQMTKLPAVEAHPQSAYVLLRNWLQSSQLIVNMGTQFGGPVSVMCVDKIIKTLDRVAAGERNWHLPQPGEKQDASGENYDAALMHLALLLCLFSDGILFDNASTPKAEQPHPACPEAVRMFAVTLFALAYPNRVFDSRSPRKPISVASGLPIRPNADQEQFVLCCFRDQSFEHVDGNRNQGKNAEGNEDAAAVDRAFAALMDPYSLQDLRVVCLTDCDVQKRTVSTPTTGQSERIFWLSRHDHNSWDVEVNREAFLHYEIVDCAEELERSRRVHRATVLTRNQNRELHFLREEDITDFDAQCVMQRWTVERIGMSCRSGVPCLGFQNLAGLSDAEIYRKSVQFVQRARVGEKILRAVVGLGDANLPSAHVANASLFYEERYSGISAHHGRFHVPFASLGARLRGIEETTTAGNDSAPSLKSCFTSALTKVECDNQELIAGLLERSGGKTSMVLPFLPGAPQSATDYALEDFFWERYAALADGDDADAEDEELPGVASAVLTMCAEEGLDVDTVIAEPAICCQKIRSALEDIGKQVTKSRKTVKHLRTLTRLGLLNLESELVRRNVRGSHITYHGPGGAATIVRNHRGTAPLTSKQFVEKAQQLGGVGGERGGA
eukprot:g4168.t1